MDLLIEHPAKADGIKAKPIFLGPGIGIKMELPRGMEVHMAVQAGDAQARMDRFSIMGCIELFLRKLGD